MMISNSTKVIAAAAFAAAVLLTAIPAQSQVSIGFAGGIDVDTDATLAGVAARLQVKFVLLGVNGEFGKGEESGFDGLPGDLTYEYDVTRLNFPIAYPINIGDTSEFQVFPFVAPGWYFWSCESCDKITKFTFDVGAGVKYNILFANGFFRVLDRDHGPKGGARLGILFTLGE